MNRVCVYAYYSTIALVLLMFVGAVIHDLVFGESDEEP